MQINEELLVKLEKLAMIEIDPSKKEEIQIQLSEILGFVDNIASLDTQNIQILSHLRTPLREDKIQTSQARDTVLSYAPDAQDGFFIVPKIIE